MTPRPMSGSAAIHSFPLSSHVPVVAYSQLLLPSSVSALHTACHTVPCVVIISACRLFFAFESMSDRFLHRILEIFCRVGCTMGEKLPLEAARARVVGDAAPSLEDLDRTEVLESENALLRSAADHVDAMGIGGTLSVEAVDLGDDNFMIELTDGDFLTPGLQLRGGLLLLRGASSAPRQAASGALL
eukprot:CAMPEP_0173410076 /NCGR_PEP_ID=MMETSP1356-20130122/73719_1 /TAXON_ID=77927 ORGANISM="Hemiselmis virescens, Strain PCC157" /NCGR_SAMPLE_ID=MMETSP1356 /ASSEMBLY_ACC=CAM_ASM_000847 /LENGTH=186 /DNA_ID=CAMNT_0014371657 /DNA_START=166 /DNA_END=723 /DNA_ORIENTATION=-